MTTATVVERGSKPLIEFKNVSKIFDDQTVLNNINFSVTSGEFLTLLGPSGCGKTTLLRLISGFEVPNSGEILFNGKSVVGISPHQRHVHTVFQSYALFPHMDVFENVAFGLRCQKVAKAEINERVHQALRLVKLEHLAKRKATQLSGGQQQRVAIARAIVNRPLALLLDEPLSSLDYRLRKTMQIELIQLQRQLGITFIFVTHDQEEALSMSDRIVVMHEGNVEQIGTPRQVYETPKNLTVAKFIGEVNIFDSEVIEVDANMKTMKVKVDEHFHVLANPHNFQAGDKLHIIIRPEDMRAYRMDEAQGQERMLMGKVKELIYKGGTVDLIIQLHNGMMVSVEEYFNEDDEKLEYQKDETVVVNWIPGWEVVLPYEA